MFFSFGHGYFFSFTRPMLLMLHPTPYLFKHQQQNHLAAARFCRSATQALRMAASCVSKKKKKKKERMKKKKERKKEKEKKKVKKKKRK